MALRRRAEAILQSPSFMAARRVTAMVSSNFLLPKSIQMEPTSKCNLACTFCMKSRVPNEPGYDMPFHFFRSIVNQLNPLRTRRLSLTGLGEPLLNPRIISMVKYAKKNGFSVGFFSNFTLMNTQTARNLINAGLDWIDVSLDSVFKENFERIRAGANFDEITENVKQFVKIRNAMNKTRPKISLHVTMCDHNNGETNSLVAFARSLNIDAIDFFPQVVHPKRELGRHINASIERRKSQNALERALIAKNHASCKAMASCYITFDGLVLPCGIFMALIPRDEYSHFQLGDLNHQSLAKIWFSSRYRWFRKRVALGYYSHICGYCPILRP